MRFAFILAVSFLSANVIRAQTNEDADRCREESNPDLAIHYCTRTIDSGQLSTLRLALTFYDRGIAYHDKGVYDRAIQDYNAAIRLNPNFAYAFNNRGNAYLFAPPCLTQEGKQSSQSQRAGIPTYPNNSGGLKKLIQDILKASKSGNHQLVANYANALVIPDPEAWFRRVFGEARGKNLTADYLTKRSALPFQLAESFGSVVQQKMTDIDIRRFDRTCDPNANDHQYPLLAARQEPEPLFEVRFFRGTYGTILWAFAYIDGGFRYAGDLLVKPMFPSIGVPMTAGGAAPRSMDNTEPPRIQVGGTVQHVRLVHRVAPVYPDQARRAGLQGTVRLAAIIARDGSIQSLQVVQGHCWLAEAAVKAVEQWRYSPTLLEGRPVEVLTTIDVVFTLSMRP